MRHNQSTARLPVCDYRDILGHASTAKQARNVILALAPPIAHGFHLHVWKRSALMSEITGLPEAWIFSISNSRSN